ncbi:MAG: hypothetical protein ACFFDI_26955, partial [Promethearchaeota archaeon]
MKFERSLISVTIILLFLSLSILNVQCKVPSENEAFTMNNKITIRSYIEDVFAEETTVYCREHNNITIYDCSSPGEPIILGEYSSELELGSDFFVKEGYVYQIGSKYSQDLKIPEQKLSFQIIDSHKPTNPQLVGEWQMEVKDDYYFYGFIDETIVEGNIAYIISFKGHLEGGYFGELLMIDCSDLENPKLAGSYCDNYTVFHSLAVMGNLVCLLTYTDDTI